MPKDYHGELRSQVEGWAAWVDCKNGVDVAGEFTDYHRRCPRTTTESSEVRWKDGRLWVDCKNGVDGAGELTDYHRKLISQV
jgi:hypothetical protein